MGFTMCGVLGVLMPKQSFATVNVNIGIGMPPLPEAVITTPPALVIIPDTRVYFAPDLGMEIFFYSGKWYRRHGGYWYRATYYNGPWAYLPASRVPAVFVHLPRDYYRVPPGHERIPYGQLKKHEKRWKEKRHKHWKEHEDKD